MPRLRNSATGVEVETSDDVAAKLAGYEPVEEPEPKPKKAPSKAPSKSEN